MLPSGILALGGNKLGGVDMTTKLIELFHTPEGEAYATTRVDESTMTVPVKSESYKNFVRLQAYEQDAVLTPTELRDRISHDTVHAQFDGEEHPVFIRVAPYVGHKFTGLKAKTVSRTYIDLATDGSAIEISPKGWRIVASPLARFRRPAGMLPLPYPESGDVHLLRPFVNIDDDDYLLFLACLVAAFRFGRPTPIVLVTGEHGS